MSEQINSAKTLMSWLCSFWYINSKLNFELFCFLSVSHWKETFLLYGVFLWCFIHESVANVLLCFLCFPPQAALLNSFPDIFDELLQMFTVQEVAEYVRGTLGSMPSTVDIGQSMDVVKLQSIARTVESRLFFFPGETNVKVFASTQSVSLTEDK